MKACLFDIDGTLVMTGGAGQQAFADAFADAFGVEEISSAVSFAGRSDRAIATDLMREHGVAPNDENWGVFQQRYLHHLGPALQRCAGTVLPGVFDLIEKLELQGDVLIGLLTGNAQRAAELKLGYYGLWNRFAFGGFGDEHLDRNDIAATAVAEASRQRKTGDPDRPTVVVIGDTPNDIRCARSVGAKAVAVPTGHTRAAALRLAGPDLLVDTLEDHQQILDWFA